MIKDARNKKKGDIGTKITKAYVNKNFFF